MTFGSPVLLLTLLVVPASLALLIIVNRRPARSAVTYTNVDLLAGLVTRERRWRYWLPAALLLLALATAAAAAARPHARWTSVERHSSVVLLVDVSGSMSARDVEPTRLEAAVTAMRTFLDRVPKSVDVGLVQFSTEAEVLERPGADRSLVRESLNYLFPEAGTAIGDAIARSVRLVRGKGAIVLLSDGKQTNGTLGPLEGAARARANGVRIYTISLGTRRGALFQAGHFDPVPPDSALMRSIAKATGGRTFKATSAAAVGSIYANLGGTIARKTKQHEVTSWFACGAAALLLGAVGLGRLWGSALL
jgi:Ca-activated chloride channel family protein